MHVSEGALSAVLKIKAQVLLGEAVAMGPGKADLLEAIRLTGSIAAAGRSLGMSYRRTRDLVDTLNDCWRVPLIEANKGGAKHGGSRLTEAGEEVLRRYRALESALQIVGEREGRELLDLSG